MAADIDIINAALRKLGENALLAVTDPGPVANLAASTYDDIRDALLREFPWNFALKRAALSANAVAPIWGYAFAYNHPTDSLRIQELENANNEEWRNEDGMIVTDIEAPLNILYVVRVAAEKMDATFRDALAARLAMEWAEPLTQTSTVGEAMARLYQNKLGVARIADGQEDRVRTVDANDFIDVR